MAIVGPPRPAASRAASRARARRPRSPRRSGPGTGSRSRRRARSGSAGRRSRPSSASRRADRARRRRAPPRRARAPRGSRRRRERKTSEQGQRHHHHARPPRRTSSASFSAPAEAVDHHRDPRDRRSCRRAGQSRVRACPSAQACARRRFVDDGADQPQGAVTFGIAQIRPQAHDDLGRVVVGEQVGEPSLRRAARAAQVEDDRGDEVRGCRGWAGW